MPQRLKPTQSSESNDLRNAGLKVTLPRLKILDILADGSARHMSAEDIYKKLLVSNEDVGLATVYRVLTQFEAAGLVTRHHFEGGTELTRPARSGACLSLAISGAFERDSWSCGSGRTR